MTAGARVHGNDLFGSAGSNPARPARNKFGSDLWLTFRQLIFATNRRLPVWNTWIERDASHRGRGFKPRQQTQVRCSSVKKLLTTTSSRVFLIVNEPLFKNKVCVLKSNFRNVRLGADSDSNPGGQCSNHCVPADSSLSLRESAPRARCRGRKVVL